ncbi:MAG: 3-isopropylmalate dehydratase, partial [Chloroflexota bacterium]
FLPQCLYIGLPVLICDTTQIEDGDLLEIDLARGSIHNLSRNSHLSSGQVPRVMLRILEEGGIIPYIKRYGGFEIK